MPGQSTTLRHVLTQEKPCVPCATEAGRNATYAGWPQLESSGISIWDEFNLTNLNASYGHILNVPIPEGLMDVPQADQVLAGVSLAKEEHLNYLIEGNDQILQKALRLAKSHLDLHPGIVLKHDFMAADQSTPMWLSHGARRTKINHLIRLDDSPGPTCLVVGLMRSSSRWSGRAVAGRLEDNMRKELVWPLKQLANACVMAKTRYGYIQTDEEMVVCRFARNGPEWKVAIMPIPWSRYGCHVLTTDLALWWICMMAMSTHQPRDIVGEAQMANISDWDVVQLGQGRWVRRHLYSGVVHPTNSPPPSSSTY
ncbi:hypothetical protein MRS44_009217 [Fusarium solani]|uniref:Uncharacterized protein n=1 Tax=Fusarium solani TaxID=169388 RepID=A0A9P9HP77_FUSSL|nr:uncharacterized protein B0J15DRAFT_548185 [Fusarium solani]KAH7260588.1 hypothetical protein B0J15DRAFT_548185 [Fusarium solani]KAJ3464431.1 hypothetical protein MRS44_009217 [Fusarium solani]